MEFAPVLVITLVVIACFAFFRTSKVKVTIDYENDGKKQEGKPDGLVTVWDENGNVIAQTIFKDGKAP